jgi:electron-transferring-flavoprotein dehydrogenase
MSTFIQHSSLSTPDERESLEADVLFVGGGPGSLSGALYLSRLVEKHNRQVDDSGVGARLEPMIVLIEKASEIGSHALSGAVLDPIALEELFPDYKERGCPIEAEVAKDDVYYLTRSRRFRIPYLPPVMSNHGNKIVSLAKLTRWLAGLVEQAGVNVFPGFAGVEILEDGSRVAGVRTGDKGINAAGERRSNFEPGIDLKSRVTVFGDGPRGYLSKELIRRRQLLKGGATQVFETGVKEIFEMPAGRTEPGRVIHTMGYPFKRDSVGGAWIYHMADNLISVGLVVPLDSKDPFIDQHRLFQEFKQHPFIKQTLKGGKPVQYGAKVISAGGYYSVPKLYVAGALIIGEAGSMVDMQRFKGIHLAMKSGMLAAERIYECLKNGDFSEASLAPYEQSVYRSYVGKSLHRVRNFHQAVSKGLPRAFFHIGIQTLASGGDVLRRAGPSDDYETTRTVRAYHGRDLPAPPDPEYDGTYTVDKLSDVYLSGTQHGEDQPPHLKILDSRVCIDDCVDRFRYPCNRFCPAKVYEMLTEENTGKLALRVNYSNCVHCQTCDIKCPLNNIRWTPPEGGQGPKYTLL